MLASVTNADGSTVNYDYDQLDQLLAKKYDEEQQAIGLYGYDSEGRRVQI
jgi:YD repeat-containing protein